MNLMSNIYTTKFINKLQLKMLKKVDPTCEEIIIVVDNVLLNFYDHQSNEWTYSNYNGPLFLYRTKDIEKYSMILLNNNLKSGPRFYSMSLLHQYELSYEAKCLVLNSKENYSSYFYLPDEKLAKRFFDLLNSAIKIGKGLKIDPIRNLIVEKEEKFSTKYSNEKMLDLFSNSKLIIVEKESQSQWKAVRNVKLELLEE